MLRWIVYLQLIVSICLLVGCGHRASSPKTSTARTTGQPESSARHANLSLHDAAVKLVDAGIGGRVDEARQYITEDGLRQHIVHNAAWQGDGIQNWLAWMGTWPNCQDITFCYDKLDPNKANPILPINYSAAGLSVTWSIRFSKREGSWKADQATIGYAETM